MPFRLAELPESVKGYDKLALLLRYRSNSNKSRLRPQTMNHSFRNHIFFSIPFHSLPCFAFKPLPTCKRCLALSYMEPGKRRRQAERCIDESLFPTSSSSEWTHNAGTHVERRPNWNQHCKNSCSGFFSSSLYNCLPEAINPGSQAPSSLIPHMELLHGQTCSGEIS